MGKNNAPGFKSEGREQGGVQGQGQGGVRVLEQGEVLVQWQGSSSKAGTLRKFHGWGAFAQGYGAQRRRDRERVHAKIKVGLRAGLQARRCVDVVLGHRVRCLSCFYLAPVPAELVLAEDDPPLVPHGDEAVLLERRVPALHHERRGEAVRGLHRARRSARSAATERRIASAETRIDAAEEGGSKSEGGEGSSGKRGPGARAGSASSETRSTATSSTTGYFNAKLSDEEADLERGNGDRRSGRRRIEERALQREQREALAGARAGSARSETAHNNERGAGLAGKCTDKSTLSAKRSEICEREISPSSELVPLFF